MTDAPDTAAQEGSPPNTPFRRAPTLLREAAETLLQRVQAAIAHGGNPYLARRHAKAVAKNPVKAEEPAAKTEIWVEAISRTLSGDTHYLPPIQKKGMKRLKPYSILTKSLRAEAKMAPSRPRDEEQR